MLAMVLGLPSWLKVAIVSIALIGVINVRHWFIERGLRKEIATVTQALKTEKAATAELRVAVADVSANRDQLQARIREQNRAIELLQAQARQADARAALAATRALQAGHVVSEALRAPDTHVPPGHAAMNLWFQETFAR